MIRELIDTDLEAVAGGTSNVVFSIPTATQILAQNNSLNQTGVALGGSVLQAAGPQSNVGAQVASFS
jgi:hypothetical protein